MQYKRIINFDTIFSTKINSNPFYTNFLLTETLRNVSKITLKSIEIPISNFRQKSLKTNNCLSCLKIKILLI